MSNEHVMGEGVKARGIVPCVAEGNPIWFNRQPGSPVRRDQNEMNRHPRKQRFWQVTGSAVCLVAILATLGGHWLALQSFAWARMIRDYSERETLGVAISKTFDGRHPCGLCLKIREGRQQESQQQKLPGLAREKSPDLFWDPRRVTVPLPLAAAAAAPCFPKPFCAEFIDSPPTPPPRRG